MPSLVTDEIGFARFVVSETRPQAAEFARQFATKKRPGGFDSAG
jgi:hypothetical protein